MNIWVNGCFDVLHGGHLDLLWYAKLYNVTDLSNKNNLYVGIDSDSRVRELKGVDRPINNEISRIRMLSNLRMINALTIFNNDIELEDRIKLFNIDYIIVGDHYRDKRVIGSEFSKKGVVFYPTDKRSSTSIINKMNI